MKRVLPANEETTISIHTIAEHDNDLDGVVALKTDGKIYILIGLLNGNGGLSWAFHPLFHDGSPLYQKKSLEKVLTEAANKHHVFFFDTQSEFLEWAPTALSS